MVRDIDHMVNYIIKFVIPTRLTNRELEIITAGLQLRFRIGSRHWKKSARIIQKIPSLSYYPSKPIFTRPPHLNHFCLVQISFNACRIMNIHKKTTFIFYPYFYRNIQLGIVFGCQFAKFLDTLLRCLSIVRGLWIRCLMVVCDDDGHPLHTAQC